MKFLIILFFLPSWLLSQESQNLWLYAEIVGDAKILNSKEFKEVFIDFGLDTKMSLVKDEKGKTIKFETLVDAMNYMGKNGWEFVQAYNNPEPPVYRWVIRSKAKLNDKGNLVPIRNP